MFLLLLLPTTYSPLNIKTLLSNSLLFPKILLYLLKLTKSFSSSFTSPEEQCPLFSSKVLFNASTPASKSPEDLLQSLFGSHASSMSISEETLRAALQLKTEQERTKQEFYRLELQRKMPKSFKMLSITISPNNVSNLVPT